MSFPELALDTLRNLRVTAEPRLSRPLDWLDDVLDLDELSFDWRGGGSSQRERMLLDVVEREEKLFLLEAVRLLQS